MVRDTLLTQAEARLFQPLWSADIMAELERNLQSDIGLAPDQTRRLVGAMQRAFPRAMVRGYEDLVSTMTNDPKDRHILAAAVSGRAGAIVTENKKDFPPSSLSAYGLRCLSADEFLSELFQAEPERVFHALDQQVSRFRTPTSVDQQLEKMAAPCPRFAATVRGWPAQQRGATPSAPSPEGPEAAAERAEPWRQVRRLAERTRRGQEQQRPGPTIELE